MKELCGAARNRLLLCAARKKTCNGKSSNAWGGVIQEKSYSRWTLKCTPCGYIWQPLNNARRIHEVCTSEYSTPWKSFLYVAAPRVKPFFRCIFPSLQHVVTYMVPRACTLQYTNASRCYIPTNLPLKKHAPGCKSQNK